MYVFICTIYNAYTVHIYTSNHFNIILHHNMIVKTPALQPTRLQPLGVPLVRRLLLGGSGRHPAVAVPSHRRHAAASGRAGESGAAHPLRQAHPADRGAGGAFK